MATSGRGTATDSMVLQSLLGKAAFTLPLGCYTALLSATPTADNGTFTELTGNAYARAGMTGAATNASTDWSSTTTDATGVWKTNANAITFPTATPSAWTAATGFGLYDAITTGSLLYWGTFAGPSTVGIGATASFATGALKVTEA
jgi:hypothetical protein